MKHFAFNINDPLFGGFTGVQGDTTPVRRANESDERTKRGDIVATQIVEVIDHRVIGALGGEHHLNALPLQPHLTLERDARAAGCLVASDPLGDELAWFASSAHPLEAPLSAKPLLVAGDSRFVRRGLAANDTRPNGGWWCLHGESEK